MFSTAKDITLKHLSNLPKYWVLGAVLVAMSALSLLGQWFVFPLYDSIYATHIKGIFLGVSVPFYMVFLMALISSYLTIKINPIAALILSWLTVVLVFSIPIITLLYNDGLFLSYLVQSKLSIAINQISVLYLPLNQVSQPVLEPVTDIANAWDTVKILMATLSVSWFFCAFFVIGLHLLICNNVRLEKKYTFGVGFFIIIFFITANIEGINNFIVSSQNLKTISQLNTEGKSKQALDVCQLTIRIKPLYAYSDSMMGDCFLAVLKNYKYTHPLTSYTNLVWKKNVIIKAPSLGAEPLFIYTYNKLLINEIELRKTLKSDLDVQLLNWLLRYGEQAILSNIKKAVTKHNESYALNQVLTLIKDDNLLKNYYLAMLYNKSENPEKSAYYYKLLVTDIEYKRIKADMLCGLGDAYHLSGKYLLARKAYFACRNIDKAYNFRAAKALSGT